MELKGVLQSASGTKGTALLVTTRLDKVASIMETYPVHRLTQLSEEDSLSLFKHHAFGPNREEREELIAIGKDIAKKCAGLPLGSLLRYESQVQQWRNVKESEIWNIREEGSRTSEENSVMPALKLSYVNLELSLRRCFTFCVIFPKGSEIFKEDLIHLWMANGFIKSEGNLQLEDVGNKVWEKLYCRSFFQEAKANDGFAMITSFKMHDLFHDLAQSIMGEECQVSEQTSLTHLSTRVHHLHSLIYHKVVNKAAFKKVESLRTYLDAIPDRLSTPLFRQFPSNHCLRALWTYSCKLSPLKGLAHLRYLHLKFSFATNLPNFICELQQLQTLKLQNCINLRYLPKDLTRLQDLRHLVIKRCPVISGMPPNIGKLSHLRTLTIFIVGSKPGHGLAELRALKLGGKLHINGLQNVPSELDAKQANLINKKDLNSLYFSWGRDVNSGCGNVNVEQVLEALEPPSTLKNFGVRGYKGMQLPSWMRNVSVLKELVKVILYNCVNCEQLPPLGKLPHLKRLFLSGMENVKHIDIESYDGVEEKAFPSLEKLTLEKLPNLEGMLRDDGVEILPLLSQLSINDVPNLKLPPLPSIEDLHVRDIEDVDSFMKEGGNMPCLKTLKIEACSKLKALPNQLGRFGGELEELKVKYCDELESFPEHVLQGLISLRALKIKFCKKLKSLSEGMGHLSCLESLYVRHCPELMSLPSNMNQLTALREVSIKDSTIPEGLQCIPSLQSLLIEDCECPSLPDWLGDITSLQELKIDGCKELLSLPSSIQRLTNLRKLIIYDPSLDVKQRCKRKTGEDWQYIAHIPQVEIEEVFKSICEAVRVLWSIFRQAGLRAAVKAFQGDIEVPRRDAFERMVDG